MRQVAVHRWPGPAPEPQDGLLLLFIDARKDAGARSPGAQRDIARRLLRDAVRATLAAVLGVPLQAVAIASAPGQAPRILLSGRESSIGCSFTHDGDYALAAINLHGRIGADMMQVQDIPDWQAVARDYLGPAVAAALAATAPAERPHALASAWTQREAALKCHGLQLSEWQTGLPGMSISLALPVAELTGYIHIGDKTA